MADAGRIPQDLWAGRGPPPKQDEVLSQVADFLGKLGYDRTLKALKKEGNTHGVQVDATAPSTIGQGLLDMWVSAVQKSEDSSSGSSASESDSSSDSSESDEEEELDANDNMVDDEAEETSDDSSDEESSSSESEVATAGQKRKRAHSASSSSSETKSCSSSVSDSDSDDDSSLSSSDSDSDSSSSDSSRGRPAKRTKVGSDSDDSSDSSSASSTSSSDSDLEDKKTTPKKNAQAKSDSSSTSDSDSESSASKKKSPKSTAKTNKKPHVPKAVVKPVLENGLTDSSTSSRTIGADSPAPLLEQPQETLVVPVTTNGDMHPDRVKRLPATEENIKQLKKGNVPFQRIPTDTKVDPRFSTNEYVSYDYADRAYRDLVVTKGKGFTKEKNKKKRGSYRGGAIDLTPKGIKFDD